MKETKFIKDNIRLQFYFKEDNLVGNKILMYETIIQQLIVFNFPKPKLMELLSIGEVERSYQIQGFN